MKNIIFFTFLIFSKLVISQKLPAEAKAGWTEKIKKEYIDECIKNAGQLYRKKPYLTTKICECSSDKIIKKMTYLESLKFFSSPQEEQTWVIRSIVQSCKDEIEKQETADQIALSNTTKNDTLITFDKSLQIKVPAGFKWNILVRDEAKIFAINQYFLFGKVILQISKFDDGTFKETHSKMIELYSNNTEPKYRLSKIKNKNCPTSKCRTYDLEITVSDILANGKMYFFGKQNTYYNAYFVTTGKPTNEIVEQLQNIIMNSRIQL